jgi:hypothetical protein
MDKVYLVFNDCEQQRNTMPFEFDLKFQTLQIGDKVIIEFEQKINGYGHFWLKSRTLEITSDKKTNLFLFLTDKQ